MIFRKSLFKLLLILFSSALIFNCKSNSQNNYSSELSAHQLEHIDKEKIDRGTLFKEGYNLKIKELKKIKRSKSTRLIWIFLKPKMDLKYFQVFFSCLIVSLLVCLNEYNIH